MTVEEFDAIVERAVAARPGSPEEDDLREKMLRALECMPPDEEMDPGWEDRAVARWSARRRRRRWLVAAVIAIGGAALVAAIVYAAS